jgi:endoglucanase
MSFKGEPMRFLCKHFIISTFFSVFLTGACHSGIDAFEQNKKLGRAVNIIGYDPIWSSFETARFKAKHFQLIKQAGFDSVRINLHAFRHMDRDNGYTLSDPWFTTLDWAVETALKNDLRVLLDLHEFNAMGDDPAGTREMFLAFWTQVAPRYKEAPDTVLFEILNEPCRGVTPALWNEYMHQALAIIRQSNPHRTVVIGPAHWNQISQLNTLDLPETDRNIIVTVHYYEPMNFTHQGAPWSKHKDQTGVQWQASEEEKNAIMGDFEKAQAWSKEHKRPLLLGEFGVYDTADMPSRTRYLDFVTRTAEGYGWSWAYWQFDKDFVLYDIDKDAWNQPVIDALIPQKP